ncbi:AprI/Inh family metalloprotease inhibitor [Phreatobacter sp.]|uniref:AprI/Inh family metalloprotease inhibitor n=1 Tax=Phreatobacter sp. TaxID=1966341 RepID=UPI003F6E4AD0
MDFRASAFLALAAPVLAALVTMAPARAENARAAPAQVARALGAWELSNPAGDRKCEVAFKPERAGPGFAIGFHADCASLFPAIGAVSAWSVAPSGAIRWLDRAGTAQFEFDETELGIFESLRPGDPTVYFLTNLGLAGQQPPAADEVAGIWTLGQPAGRALCTLDLKAELAADAGALEQRFALVVTDGCERSIAALGLASWRLEREILVVAGRAGSLSFRRETDGRWIKTPQDNRPLVLGRP